MRNYEFHPLLPRPFPAHSGSVFNSAVAAATFDAHKRALGHYRKHGPADVDVFMEGYLYPSRRATREHRGRLLLHVQKTGRLPTKSEAKRIWDAVKDSARGVREFLGDRCSCGPLSTGAALMSMRHAHPGLCACNHSAGAAGLWDSIKSGAKNVGMYLKQKLSGGSFTPSKPSGGIYIDNRGMQPKPLEMGQNIHTSMVQPPGGAGVVPHSQQAPQVSNLPSSVVDMQHSMQHPVQHATDYEVPRNTNTGWQTGGELEYQNKYNAYAKKMSDERRNNALKGRVVRNVGSDILRGIGIY
jgi:hypothetical protein